VDVQDVTARSKGQYFNKAIRPHFRSELVYDAHRPGGR
jgi:hypothetical protein